MINYYFEYQSPVGVLTVISDGESIIWLGIKGQKYYPSLMERAVENPSLEVFTNTIQWLDIYFSGIKPPFTPLLSPVGSPFRQAVWKILSSIPYGTVTTYGDIAKLIANQKGVAKMSAQAVGGAIGHNPISILIPCHRVVGRGGNLTGFASGIDVKIRLLKQEHIDITNFHYPNLFS